MKQSSVAKPARQGLQNEAELACRGHHCGSETCEAAEDRVSRAAASSRYRSRGAVELSGGSPRAVPRAGSYVLYYVP